MMNLSRRQSLLYELIVQSPKVSDGNAVEFILSKIATYLEADRIAVIGKSKKNYNTVYQFEGNGHYNTFVMGIPDVEKGLESGNHVVFENKDPDKYGGLRYLAVFKLNVDDDSAYYMTVEYYNSTPDWGNNIECFQFVEVLSNLVAIMLLQGISVRHQINSQKVYEAVLDNVDMYIFVADKETDRIVFANNFFKNTFGSESEGKDYNDYIFIPHVETGSRKYIEIYSENTEEWLAVSYNSILWLDDKPATLFSCYDITAKKTYEDKIRWMAYTDHLTGLPNRYRCDTILKYALKAATDANETGYVLFIDLDDFKLVNDCYGHDYGDGVLVSFAGYLKEHFSEENFVFRFGGDEFVILISHTNSNYIYEYLDMLVKRASKPWASGGKEFYCSLSIGVVPFPVGDDKVTTILKYADIAMYEAKKRGKNNYIFYDEKQNEDSRERIDLEARLRKSLENNFQGFEVFYQPYVNLKDNSIGAEALLRMYDGKAYILPHEFLPLAEYLGFMHQLDEFVLKNAAALCHKINSQGYTNFTITVNLSKLQFKQNNLLSRTEDILKEEKVEFSNVIIGINESLAITDLKRLSSLAEGFHKMNIKISLDDFGSGNASFINLDKLPVDIVKISPVLTSRITEDDAYTAKFIELMANRAHSLGILVCMNGVETKGEYEFCVSKDIDMVQGFYLFRPDTIENLQNNIYENKLTRPD